jgi:hypothetical protein
LRQVNKPQDQRIVKRKIISSMNDRRDECTRFQRISACAVSGMMSTRQLLVSGDLRRLFRFGYPSGLMGVQLLSPPTTKLYRFVGLGGSERLVELRIIWGGGGRTHTSVREYSNSKEQLFNPLVYRPEPCEITAKKPLRWRGRGGRKKKQPAKKKDGPAQIRTATLNISFKLQNIPSVQAITPQGP